MERTVLAKEKFLLSIKEAAAYFYIGEKKLRAMAHEYCGLIAVQDGNRILIKREAMEKFLLDCSVI